MTDARERWVFGYGSLLWRPGFEFVERSRAMLRGYHRSFCIYSHNYRGTPENPGLVLGLNKGGECVGNAFCIAPDNWNAVKAYLDERELVTNTYIPADVEVELADGRKVIAHTYVADPTHQQYAGNLPVRTAVEIIVAAHGNVGPNLEYLENTVLHLDEMGITDPPLHDLMDLVRREYGEMNMGAGI
ncbi:gamma-glutamylcyclotransferase [Thalassospira lucentensis]|uniref:gamma-glutamylcyclotransferase n=1 Tax=Thalassospira lucentensis TaxID=168935 RepID=UPI003D2F1E50